jgi:archaetidylinositol phosphate synthase
MVNSILGRYEAPALQWLCRRIPLFVVPNHLTLLGLGGGIIIFIGFALSNLDIACLWVVIFGLFLNWVGDSLDGSLARFRGCERRKYGYFTDHMTDAITMTLVGVGASLSPYLSSVSSLSVLIAYLLLTLFSALEAKVRGDMRIAFCNVGPTEFRIVLGILVVCVFVFPDAAIHAWGESWNLYDAALLAMAASMVTVCVFSALSVGRELSHEDP